MNLQKKVLITAFVMSLTLNGVFIGLYTSEKLKNSEVEINQVIVYDVYCSIKDAYGNYYSNDTYIPTYDRLFDNGTIIYNSTEERIGLSLIIEYNFTSKFQVKLIQIFKFSSLAYNFSYEFYLNDFFIVTDMGFIYPEREPEHIPLILRGYAIDNETNEVMYAYQAMIVYYKIPLFEKIEVVYL